MMALLLPAAALAQTNTYACVFDCHLANGQGSARGYVEFPCSGNATTCCQWENCVQQAYDLYGGVAVCPAAGADLSAVAGDDPYVHVRVTQSWSDPSDPMSAAQYTVGVPASAAAGYPRNSFPCPNSVCSATDTVLQTCATPVKGCVGPGCSKLPRMA